MQAYLLTLAALGTAALVGSRRGSRSHAVRVYLGGGSKKLNPGMVTRLEKHGVEVVGWSGEDRSGPPLSRSRVNALVILRNAIRRPLFDALRLEADDAGIPVVIASTNVADIVRELRAAGVALRGSRWLT